MNELNQTPSTQQENNTVDTKAEVIVIDRVQAAIQNAERSFAELVKDSNIDKRAKELKVQLKKITINGIEDKDNYKKVKEISKESSKLRIAIEARRKEQKADYIIVGKKIDELANTFQLLINPIEDDADKKLEEIDNLKKEAEEKILAEKEQLKQYRISELESNGCPFKGNWWQINDISLGVQQIEESTQEQWELMITKVKLENEKNIEAKRKQDEENEIERQRQEDIRKENERKELELKKQQDEFAEQQRQFKQQQDEFAQKQREAYEAKEKQEREQKMAEEHQQLSINAKSFEAIGYKYDFGQEVWVLTIGSNTHKIHKSSMIKGGDELLADSQKIVSEFTQLKENEDEKIRLEELLKNRELELIELQFHKSENGLWVCPHIDYKFACRLDQLTIVEWQAHINDINGFWDAKMEEMRVSKLNDTEKFNNYIFLLKSVPVPNFQNIDLIKEVNEIVSKFIVKELGV